MTEAQKMINNWAEKHGIGKDAMSCFSHDFEMLVHRACKREMEEACFAIHSIPRKERSRRAICQRAIRARRWWEEKVKLPGFKDIIGLFKDGEDEVVK